MKHHRRLWFTSADLARVGRAQKLPESLELGVGMSVDEIDDEMVLTMVKAVIGAVWLDSGDLDIIVAVLVSLRLLQLRRANCRAR